MAGVALDQKLNQEVPRDIRFTDENGKEIAIGDYFGSKPVVPEPDLLQVSRRLQRPAGRDG